jgi:hypothetical protein
MRCELPRQGTEGMHGGGLGPVQVVQADQKRPTAARFLRRVRAASTSQIGVLTWPDAPASLASSDGDSPRAMSTGPSGMNRLSSSAAAATDVSAASAALAACERSSDLPAPRSPSMSSTPPRRFAAPRTRSRTARSLGSRPRMARLPGGTIWRPVPPRRRRGRSVIAGLVPPWQALRLTVIIDTWTVRVAKLCRFLSSPVSGSPSLTVFPGRGAR